MSRWGYKISVSGKIVASQGNDFPTEQTAREGAVKKMRALLQNGMKKEPFVVQVICFSNVCSPLSMEEERYSMKEVEDFGTGEYISFGELKTLAKEKYAEGGDGIYECWDQRTFDDYVRMFGPMSRSRADQLIKLQY